MNVYITIDIGGTQMRAAVYPENDTTPLRQKKIATHGDGGPTERLIKLTSEMMSSREHVIAISAMAPGAIDPESGILYQAPNIPGWENLPIRDLLSNQFKVPVMVGNDANGATLAEWRFGSGIGHHHIIFFTISTGIGGGVIIDDRLLLGRHGLATELGHVVVLPDGPLCGCGKRGHLEAMSSGTAIARYATEQIAAGRKSSLDMLKDISARDVANAAKNGDPLAIEALGLAGTYMGRAIADYLHIFNPTIVILGGGVTQSGRLFFDPLHAAITDTIRSPRYLDDLTITTAALGDDAGLLGALALAQTSIKGNAA